MWTWTRSVFWDLWGHDICGRQFLKTDLSWSYNQADFEKRAHFHKRVKFDAVVENSTGNNLGYKPACQKSSSGHVSYSMLTNQMPVDLNLQAGAKFLLLKIFEMFSFLAAPVNMLHVPPMLYHTHKTVRLNSLQCCLLVFASSCTSFLHPQRISSLAAVLASRRRVHIGFQSCGSTHPQGSAEAIYVHSAFQHLAPAMSTLIHSSVGMLYKGCSQRKRIHVPSLFVISS